VAVICQRPLRSSVVGSCQPSGINKNKTNTTHKQRQADCVVPDATIEYAQGSQYRPPIGAAIWSQRHLRREATAVQIQSRPQCCSQRPEQQRTTSLARDVPNHAMCSRSAETYLMVQAIASQSTTQSRLPLPQGLCRCDSAHEQCMRCAYHCRASAVASV
jgi:hypothetical protein